MLISVLLVCFLLFHQTASVSEKPITLEDYCKHSSKNIPCYEACRRSHRCGETSQDFQSFDVEVHKYLTRKLNLWRVDIARGDLPGEPPAEDMSYIEYDMECEFLAGCMVKSCWTNDVPILIALDGTILGYTGYVKITQFEITGIDVLLTVEEAFLEWHSRGLANYSITQTMVTMDLQSIHQAFLQMSWAETTDFGCAYMTGQIRVGRFYFSFVCVYKPEMRIHKKPAYSEGETSAKCTKVHKRFRKLCDDAPHSHGYVPPMDLNKGNNFVTQLHMFSFIIILIGYLL